MQNIVHKKSRAFNNVTIDKVHGTVTKQSVTDFEKLEDEARWYSNLPCELLPFVPRLLDMSRKNSEIVIEYCPYSTLSELFTSASRKSYDWNRIIQRLVQILLIFKGAPVMCPQKQLEEIQDFHLRKTENRVNELHKSPKFADLMVEPKIIINDKEYWNVDSYRLTYWLKAHFHLIQTSVVHGDFCLSNILYDLDSDMVKLIDPRGYLVHKSSPSIYGDLGYDYAKLLHSFHGLYDFIVQGKYALIDFGSYSYHFMIEVEEEWHTKILQYLSKIFVSEEAQKYASVLEVLLFITMIPLHYDDEQRQLAFYLRAVQLYNELDL